MHVFGYCVRYVVHKANWQCLKRRFPTVVNYPVNHYLGIKNPLVVWECKLHTHLHLGSRRLPRILALQVMQDIDRFYLLKSKINVLSVHFVIRSLAIVVFSSIFALILQAFSILHSCFSSPTSKI